MKRMLLMAVIAITMTSCVQTSYDHSANQRQVDIINRMWPQTFAKCQTHIVQHLQQFKAAGVYTTEEREEYCSCFANESTEWLVRNVNSTGNPEWGSFLAAEAKCKEIPGVSLE